MSEPVMRRTQAGRVVGSSRAPALRVHSPIAKALSLCSVLSALMFASAPLEAASDDASHYSVTSAKADLKQEQVELELLEKQLAEMENEQKAALEEVNERWARQVDQEVEVPVTPYRKDIYVDFYGIAWLPYYVISVDGQSREIPAFDQP